MELTTMTCTGPLDKPASTVSKLPVCRVFHILAWAFLMLGLGSSALAQSHSVDELQPAGTHSITNQSVSSSSPLDAAEQLYRTGKLDEAAQAYQAIIRAEGKSALAYVGLVRVYLKQ